MTLRIGAGAGFAGDRIAPARDLAERGRLDFIAFECLAERTLAYGHLQRAADPDKGFHTALDKRLGAVLPACVQHGTTIVTNMGVANPRAAGHAAQALAQRLGLKIRIAVVTGDDVTTQVNGDTWLPEMGKTLREHGQRVVGANAYLGIDALLPALDEQPHLVITGRVADPSLFLAPLVHRLGWARDDWARLGAGTAVGHLLECSMQVTGGYFADPPHKMVPNIAQLGFPLAEVAADGSAVITKLDGTGGLVSELTVKEQLMYEVHDPAAYLTPDVAADFSTARIAQVGADRVAVRGVGGRERPRQLKAIVGFDGGFLVEGEISYAGPGAAARAQLAAEIVRERMAQVHGNTEPLRLDLIGLNALHGTAMNGLPAHAALCTDVRLRAALRTPSRAMAENLLEEVESLWLGGPAGGGGYRGHITPSVTTQPMYVDREAIALNIEVLTS
ncbi:acyclic terpene utilization AtuA family protein [Hydrogenophaga atypica]|uniref:Acyclic terpene utilization AtuA family protein n=1 Tax=Hydrogenophaga atypica TaxID=249409 RepID=A0ABW2QHN0_9BURK